MSDGANGNSFPVYALFDSFGNRQTDVTTPGSFSAFQWGGAVGYQTEYADPSVPGLGLVYMEQRYYDPAIGRFISPDPIGYAGGLNLYGYAENDGVNLVDPDGLGGLWIGGVHLGDDHPWAVIDAAGVGAGLRTGVAGVGSALSFGLWDGGGERCQPGFQGSQTLAAIGRTTGLMALSLGAGGSIGTYVARYAPLLRLLKMRRGSISLPGRGSGGRMRFPSTPEEMDQMLGFEGVRRPDVDPTTGKPLPGRGRVDWDISTPRGRMRVKYEQHPYDVNAPIWHRGPHWHVEWPGMPAGRHPHYLAGDEFPGY
jgi:RHS repeat-associated protein